MVPLAAIGRGHQVVETSRRVLVLASLAQRTLVEREESYLERQVGESYRQYQARVPRWL
jgi:protein-S-isoprenylcysteine O-methyltransferase Ste14